MKHSELIKAGCNLGMDRAREIVDGHAALYRAKFEKASNAGNKIDAEKNMLIACALSSAAAFIEQDSGMRRVVEPNGIIRLVPIKGNHPNAE